MSGKEKKPRRLNLNFRQTAKAFRAARQTRVFSKINRNIPYLINKIGANRFAKTVQKIKGTIKKDSLRFAKRTQKKRK